MTLIQVIHDNVKVSKIDIVECRQGCSRRMDQ
jgi:hypothetical protein